MARNERRARGRSPIPGGSAGGCADVGIGSAAWRKQSQASLQRDLESIRAVAKKYPLDWDDETSVLIQSAAHGLSNCVVPKKGARLLSSGMTATATATATVVLGFQHSSTGFSGRCPGRGVRFSEASLITRHDREGPTYEERSSSEGSGAGSSDTPSTGAQPVPQRRLRISDEDSAQSHLDSHSSSVYIRPAIRRGIEPYAKAKVATSIGDAISSFVKHGFAYEEKWTALEDYEQEQSRHSILSDSISIISGTDTVLAGFKTPDVSAHGYDWSLHGHQRTESKSPEELRDELMALVCDYEEAGHIRIVSGALPTHARAKGKGLFGWVRKLAHLKPSCLRPITA